MFAWLHEVMHLNPLVKMRGERCIVSLQFLVANATFADILDSRAFVNIAVRILHFIVEQEHVIDERARRRLEHASPKGGITSLPKHLGKVGPRQELVSLEGQIQHDWIGRDLFVDAV